MLHMHGKTPEVNCSTKHSNTENKHYKTMYKQARKAQNMYAYSYPVPLAH